MSRFIDMIDWRRVWNILVLPGLLYTIVALATRADKLNPVLVLVLISLSVAVWIAFLPNLIRAFRKGQDLDTEALVCIGVSLAWLSNIYRPSIGLTIMMFPSLAWLRESDFSSAGLSLAIAAAVAHLAAPAIDSGRIPSKRWAKIGTAAGIATLLGLLMVYWPQVHSIWQRADAADDVATRAVSRFQAKHDADIDISDLLHDRSDTPSIRISGTISQALADRIEEWRKAQPGAVMFKTEAYRALMERGLEVEDEGQSTHSAR